ncbi:MAG: hypothetical protein WEA36_06525 [Balneolaceae bacterium]
MKKSTYFLLALFICSCESTITSSETDLDLRNTAPVKLAPEDVGAGIFVYEKEIPDLTESQAELLGRIQDRESSKTVYLIRLDGPESIKEQTAIRFNLPERTIEASVKRLRVDDPYVHWRGEVVDKPYTFSMTVDVEDHQALGKARTTELNYTFESLGGDLHVLIQHDPNDEFEDIAVGSEGI